MLSETDYPSVEQMELDLRLGGWKKINNRVWKAPAGGYFLGPFGAWKAMMRRREADLS